MNDHWQKVGRNRINETCRGMGFVQEIPHVLLIQERKKRNAAVLMFIGIREGKQA